jgi:hypothetical protein
MDWLGYWRFLGSIELWVWIIFMIFILLLHKAKEQFFNKLVGTANIRINTLKNMHNKSINDQMDYVRAKTDFGKDFVNVVVSLFLFLFVFRFLFIPRMTSFIMALCVGILVSLLLSWVAAMMFPARFREYHIINVFINFLFGTVLLSYIQFIYIPYNIILIVLTIIVMVLFEAGWNYGRNNKDRT